MKVYYLDPDIYPGTYNFKDEVVGTTGTTIDYVDNVDTAASVEIIVEIDGHKKILRQAYTSGVGGFDYSYHTFATQAKDGWWEGWIGVSDVTVEYRFGVLEGGTGIVYCRINNSKFQYFDHNSVWQDIGGAPTPVNNTLYHIRIVWVDAANDTFDFYINGTLYENGTQCFSNQTSGVNRFYIYCFTANKYLYLDAIACSLENDANYTEGENLYKKWHVSTQTEVTGIISYPNSIQQNNSFSACSMVLGDFEGALYATWSVLDQVKMRIEDDSSNVLWRGFLDNKRFNAYGLVLELVSFGKELEWKSFGSQERADYIMDKGIVDFCNANSVIDLKDDASAPFGWTVDCWHGPETDLGFMILDNTTDYSEKEWDISAINPIGSNGTGGNVASTQTFNDGDYYYDTDKAEAVNLIINLDVDGLVIDSTTEELKSIEIQFNWRIKVRSISEWNKSWVKLQIKKDTKWITFSEGYRDVLIGIKKSGWYTGIPFDIESGNGLEHVIIDTDDELQKYFDKTGADYSSLKGLRFVVSGSRGVFSTDYTRVDIDFIKVFIKHHAEDVLPIMYKITDNTATTITCEDVANWQLMGITNDSDRFYIGENTRKILDDVAQFSGVGIDYLDTRGDEEIVPNADTTTEWAFPAAGTHFDDVAEDKDSPDGNVVKAINEDVATEEYGLSNFTLPTACTVRRVDVWFYAKYVQNAQTLSVWLYDGSNHLTSDGIIVNNLAFEWFQVTWDNLNLNQAALDAFRIKFMTGIMAANDEVHVDTIYLDIYYDNITLTKYLAREFKGCHCIDPLKAVCNLEGAIWCEDHINEKIKVLKPGDFTDSTISLTQANYDIDWDYEDQCNAVREVHVWGNSTNEVYANAKDLSVDSRISKQIVDNTIMTNADAKEIADDLLALWKTKRPSLKLTLDGVNADLVLGTYVNVTFARPTIAAADYKIRRIERSKKGISGYQTILYAGLGDTLWDEKIVKEIRLANYLAHKSMTDKL